MVTALQHDSLTWLSPAPLWGSGVVLDDARGREKLLRPAILRYAHDAFMDELFATLTFHPSKLGEWRAAAESWEHPMLTPPTAAKLALPEPVSQRAVRLARALPGRSGGRAESSALAVETAPNGSDSSASAPGGEPSKPLKLFQPIQQRHYLVTASLVCQRAGLPDRRVDAGKQERAAFVLRRVVLAEDQDAPAEESRSWDEYAFVLGSTGPYWERVKSGTGDRADRIVPREERLTMFSIGFDEDSGRQRRLFGGVIPAGRREAYVGARMRSAPAGATVDAAEAPIDPRMLFFHLRISGPWSELVRQTRADKSRIGTRPPNFPPDVSGSTAPPSAFAPTDSVARAAREIQTHSWYILLDLERFLFTYVRRVHDVLRGERSVSELNGSPERPLYDFLQSLELDPMLIATPPIGTISKSNLLEVLEHLAKNPSIGEGLERIDTPYRPNPSGSDPDGVWPTFLFPLADAGALGPFPFPVGGIERDELETFAELEGLVANALPSPGDTPLPEVELGPTPQLGSGDVWFAIRCVYERPNCGPPEGPVVSEPTEPFQIAGFFDPEAPARPVRIPLPFDISPKGLRKYNRSTTLMVSDMLCAQVKKIRALTLGDLVLSVLPWPFHKDLPSIEDGGPCGDSSALGMFCSLSIPIVTLCALILLLIIVALFDIFFHWIPLLFICFRIGGLKGKPA